MARQMKDSGVEWIGEIPEDWEVRKLKNIARIQTGNTPDKKNPNYYTDKNGLMWIKSDNLDGINPIKHTAEYLSNEGIKVARVATKGSTLVCCIGSIGKFGIIEQDAAYNQQINAITFRNNAIINKYGMYLIAISDSQHWLYANGNVLKILNNEGQGKIQLAYPSIVMQQKIVSFLDEKVGEIDSIIAKTKETIEDYKKYKQAIITDAVIKGLNLDVEMKESKNSYLGMIPVHWAEKRLRFLGMCQNGISKSSEFFGEGYPFVSYGDVYKNYTLPEMGSGLIKSSEDDRKIYSVQYGDVFFTRTSETIEEVGFASTCLKTIDDATFAGFVIRFRPNDQEELLPEFSKYYFRSDAHRKFFVKEMNLVTRASLSQELLKKLPVLLPPLEEQREIAEYLDEKCTEIDKLIAKKEELLADLESYKKSLIYEYVTGKKEIE